MELRISHISLKICERHLKFVREFEREPPRVPVNTSSVDRAADIDTIETRVDKHKGAKGYKVRETSKYNVKRRVRRAARIYYLGQAPPAVRYHDATSPIALTASKQSGRMFKKKQRKKSTHAKTLSMLTRDRWFGWWCWWISARGSRDSVRSGRKLSLCSRAP